MGNQNKKAMTSTGIRVSPNVEQKGLAHETAAANSGSNDLVSFETYGEATTVPIQIRRAAVDAAYPAPFLRRYLASLELTVVNSTVRKEVSGRLRITLPVGATVKKFEVLRSDQWYPAVAVPKKKAKEVVYREKEKGRDVAAVSDVGSNVFEIEVSPLPFEQEVKCRLECMLIGEVKEFWKLARTYFPNEETEWIFTSAGVGDDGPMEAKPVEDENYSNVGGAVVGESFGKTHFVCRVPPFIHQSSGLLSGKNNDVNRINRIAVVWDVSASMSRPANLVQKRCERLRELAVKCNEHSEKPMSFELYTFGTGAAAKEGIFSNVEDLIDAITDIDYDGGTDITALSALFSQLSLRQQDKNLSDASIDSILVFTDGMDNLGRLPEFEGLHSVPFPVHVVADSQRVNLRCARAIASTSPQYPGSIFSENDESYVSGVLYPQAILRSIKTDQSDDAFMEEIDDGFRCVPDHRLQYLNEPIGSQGLLISGILGGQQSVSTLVAEIIFGGEVHECNFQLRSDGLGYGVGKKAKKTHDQGHIHIHHYEAVNLLAAAKPIDQTSSKPVDPSRILGYIYAEETYRAAENFSFKSGMDMKSIQEELSVQYGFCSPESSLLMLYEIEQFLENDVVPPKDHPVYGDERAVQERKRRENQRKSHVTGDERLPNDNEQKPHESYAVGEIGGLKSEDQKKKVVRLAQKMETYFSTPAVSVEELQRQRQSHAESRVMSEPAMSYSHLACGISNESEMVLQSADLSAAAQPRMSQRRMCASSSPPQIHMSQRRHVILSNFLCERLYSRGSSASGASSFLYDRSYSRGSSASGACEGSVERSMRAMWAGSPITVLARIIWNLIVRLTGFGFMLIGSVMNTITAAATSRVGAMDMEFEFNSESGDVVPSTGAADIRIDQSAVAPPKDPTVYAEKIEESLKGESQDEDWIKEYQAQREKMSVSGTPSPSFFLTCARLALKYKKSFDAIRIVTNCLEMEIDDVQMLRCVAYFLLSTNDDNGVGLARQLFDKVQELQPCEPQSFLDSALVRFWTLARSNTTPDTENCKLKDEVVCAQKLIAHVLTHTWASRFDEIEWPALILLHYVAEYTTKMNEKLQIQGTEDALPVWPTSELATFQSKVATVLYWGTDPLRCSKFEVSLMVWMGWDSDETDVDLHVVEPTKNEVYYGNKTSSIGGSLSRDFTQGYGPEVYLLKDYKREADGCRDEFDIFAKYYASHQDSALTGTTSVLLWTIEKNRKNGENIIDFLNIRLDTHKEKTKVKTVQLKNM